MTSSADAHTATEVVVIGGRSGSGKSSVAAELGAVLGRRRVMHAVVCGDVLDLAWPPPWEHGLAERNLAALWRNYRDLGYHRLVYENTAATRRDTQPGLAAALRSVGPLGRVSSMLLEASDATVRDRLARREIGSELDAHLERSARASAELERMAAPGTVRIATDDVHPTDLAERIIEIAGWGTAS